MEQEDFDELSAPIIQDANVLKTKISQLETKVSELQKQLSEVLHSASDVGRLDKSWMSDNSSLGAKAGTIADRINKKK